MTALPGAICPKCGAVHNPNHCHAHSKRQGGAQCQRPPCAGMTVCATHGGRSPQNVLARNDRFEVGNRLTSAAVATIRRPTRIDPVTDPLYELQVLAGEAKWWKEVMAGWVEQLKSVRYDTDGGEQIRGEVVLFERALDRLGYLLINIAKLNIDERLVRIEEERRTMILAALEAGFAVLELTPDQTARARAAVADRLRVLAVKARTIEAA